MRGVVVPALRQQHPGPIVRQPPLAGRFTCGGVLAKHHAVGIRNDGKSAQIKQLVVQSARGFRAGTELPDAQVEAAHAAAVPIAAQHPLL